MRSITANLNPILVQNLSRTYSFKGATPSFTIDSAFVSWKSPGANGSLPLAVVNGFLYEGQGSLHKVTILATGAQINPIQVSAWERNAEVTNQMTEYLLWVKEHGQAALAQSQQATPPQSVPHPVAQAQPVLIASASPRTKRLSWGKLFLYFFGFLLAVSLINYVVNLANGTLPKDISDRYLDSARVSVSSKSYALASYYVNKSDSAYRDNPPADSLKTQLDKLTGEKDDVLLSLSPKQVEALKAGRFDSTFLQSPELNTAYLDSLRANVPKLKLYQERREARAREEEEKAKAAALAQRETEIQKHFSAWSGAHIQLERMVKTNLNDPNSYEHKKTTYFDRGDHLIVNMQYRAKNGFGALVNGFTKAKVSSTSGEVIEILD